MRKITEQDKIKILKTLNLTKHFIKEITSLKDKNGNPYKVAIYEGRDGFAANPPSLKHECIKIKVDFSDKPSKDIGSLEFVRNATMRSPVVKKVSHYTFSLLHELGHLETYKNLPSDYHRKEAEAQIYQYRESYKIKNLRYFLLPDEYAATDWVINWLRNPKNIRKAKRFEKNLKTIWNPNTLYF